VKIVLDTSVLIAAFFRPLAGPSFSREVFDHLVASEDDLFSSPYILQEFRQKCLKKLGFTVTETDLFERQLKKRLQVVTPEPGSFEHAPTRQLRDPNDQPILDLAAVVRADFLMTWDKDLLVLRHLKQTRILTPREFWDFLGEQG